jgi:uncharacterized membrane protein
MMTDTSDRLIRDYLDELRAGTRDLPKRRREDLLGEIEAHIAEALPPGASEAETRKVLDRLGDPAQIAAEERGRLGIAPARAGALEWIAVVLLLIGGVVVPVVGWIAGVVLLWTSSVWSLRDKLIGTFVVPGGLLPALYFTVAPVSVRSLQCEPIGRQGSLCVDTGQTVAWRVFGLALVVVLTVAPIVTAIYLGRRAKGNSPVGA